MRGYTTISQSKKLLELGLSPESADMFYEPSAGFCTEPSEVKVADIKYAHPRSVPCWSLAALIELMPKCILEKSELGMYKCYSANAFNSAVDVIFDNIVWLLENGHIKTE